MKPFISILHIEDDPNDADLVQAKLEDAGLACQITIVQDRDEIEKETGRFCLGQSLSVFQSADCSVGASS